MNAQFIFSSSVALALAHSLWQCALFALLAALSFWLLRHTSARWRHAVGMFWMLAMLIAPLLTFWMLLQSATTTEGVSQPELTSAALPFHVRALSGYGMLASPSPLVDWLLVAAAQCWLIGVAIMLALHFGGWRLIRRIERQPYQALPSYWLQRTAVLQAALNITRNVSVRLADHVVSPFTAHVLRPVIWLPLSLLTQLPQDQIEALLLHELAHIRRLDWVWNGLQCLIEAILFYHPGMWWLSKRIRQEREYACDDLAVAACGDAIALAEALAALHYQQQTNRRGSKSNSPRFGLAADGGSLMKRITHLLSDTPKLLSWRVPGALLFLFCSGSLLAMQVQPPEHLLTNLLVHASSNGALTPGNYREYTASYFPDKQRSYRVSLDAQGKLIEVYKEDGKEKPITDHVRVWISSMIDMNGTTVPPAPPALPAMPALTAIPVPAAPPPPPAPPAVTESEEFKNMIHPVLTDNRLISITGSPVRAEDKSFHGSIHTWGSRDFHIWGIDDPVGGKAEFTVAMVGPKGRALVAYSGKTEKGEWQAKSLSITALAN